ncbi:MAG TPA: heme lyase CcmF/NrfE family subunit [Solirubrobacterales bacterium]|nr:heme lyase CcmF/NrfE family subunit [Solirubrobacterales bacterium]
MNALGAAALGAALLTSIYALVAAVVGARSGDRRWVDSSRRAFYALMALLVLAVISLEAAFLRSDFSVRLVADHSSTTTPTLYKVTAMWGSQAGSLLLWAFVLSIAGSAALFATRHSHREVAPWATAVMAAIATFFVGMMMAGIVFPDAETYPFATFAAGMVPVEGAGLTPLLRHPAMAIHPPMLYSGYVFFTIPFAFAIGALITRRLDASWIRSTRRFALIAWVFLSIGLALGAFWSYAELGWGGYWAWDPVENAALMPWLVGTAFIHSIMVQERRGMLKMWNVSLIVATFALSLLGTFLVRSGVLQSIHAFGESKVGLPLLVLIATVLIGSTLLIISRADSLRSERRIDSLLSREAMFLLNNLLFVGLAVIVFWGTFFPLISEAFTGQESSLAAPWYNRYTTPVGIGLLLLAGVGPLVAWRRVSVSALRRMFALPLAAALAAGVLIVAIGGGGSEPLALALFVAGAFTLAAVGQELWRGTLARRALTGEGFPSSLGGLMSRNRRRYGGYIVHIGIALLLIGIAASSSFQTSRDVRLLPGESATVGDYTVTYVEPTSQAVGSEQKLVFGAVLDVRRDGEQVAVMRPSREYFSSRTADPTAPLRGFFEGEATSEVGRSGGVTRDLWTAMQPDLTSFEPIIEEGDEKFERFAAGIDFDDPAQVQLLANLQGEAILGLGQRYLDETPPADIRFNVNPFVIWVWIGGIVGTLGALFALWPGAESRRRRVGDVYATRLARELRRT